MGRVNSLLVTSISSICFANPLFLLIFPKEFKDEKSWMLLLLRFKSVSSTKLLKLLTSIILLSAALNEIKLVRFFNGTRLLILFAPILR